MESTKLWGQPKAQKGWVDSRRLGAPQGCKKHAKDRDTPCSHETGNTGHIRENGEAIEGRAHKRSASHPHAATPY